MGGDVKSVGEIAACGCDAFASLVARLGIRTAESPRVLRDASRIFHMSPEFRQVKRKDFTRASRSNSGGCLFRAVGRTLRIAPAQHTAGQCSQSGK